MKSYKIATKKVLKNPQGEQQIMLQQEVDEYQS